MINRAITH